MIARRAALAFLLAATALPALAEEGESCGCGGPKSSAKGRAAHLYAMALAAKDPEKRKRLAEAVLRLEPDHEGALKLLAALEA